MDYPDDMIEPALVPYAIAVGTLCNSWAKLESGIRCLFIIVSGMAADRDSFGIAHCFDIRDQINAIKIGFISKSREDGMPDAALTVLGYIDNVLRPHRNRYVHDIWHYWDDSESVARFDYRPRVFRPQARQPLDWTPLTIEANELAKIWDTIRDIETHHDALRRLQDCFYGRAGAVESLLQAPPERRLAPLQSGTQYPKGCAKPRRKHLPKSSPE